jgi:hypothetical protein
MVGLRYIVEGTTWRLTLAEMVLRFVIDNVYSRNCRSALAGVERIELALVCGDRNAGIIFQKTVSLAVWL